VIIKFLGMGIIMLSSTLMGICFSQRLASRERELNNLYNSLQMLFNELSFSMAPIKDIMCTLSYVAQGECKEMLELLKHHIESGKSAPESWVYSIEKCAHKMSLTKEDMQYLVMMSPAFDAYEIDEQKMRLKEIMQRILLLAENAKNVKTKNSKLVKMLGVYGGVLLCIIIF